MTAYRHLSAVEAGLTWTTATPPTEQLGDPEVFVHHVGGAAYMGGTPAAGADGSRTAAIAVARALNEYAKRPKAEGGKGYQFLDYDDLVWFDRFNDICWIIEGRGAYRSAATLDRNEEGEAVCLCGNTDLRQPHPAELEGVALAIVKAIGEGRAAKDAKVLGHRDNPAHPNATTCPGKFLYVKLDEIRARVAELLTPPPPGDDAMTPEQSEQLKAIYDALIVASPANPSTAIMHQVDQLHTIMSGAFWPNHPNITDVSGGELATRIRSIEAKLDALAAKIG